MIASQFSYFSSNYFLGATGLILMPVLSLCIRQGLDQKYVKSHICDDMLTFALQSPVHFLICPQDLDSNYYDYNVFSGSQLRDFNTS